MLETCEQLAAGLGASGNGKKQGGVGNAPLRLWVGERFLGIYFSLVGGYMLKCGCSELHKRAGNEAAARQQIVANERLLEAVGPLKG
jgi:hypothetical protein